MGDQLTWAEIREAVAALHEGLAGAHDQARDNILSPRTDVLAGTEYRNAFADLQWEVDGLRARAERLVERMAESPVPARPLEAVLAEIDAEGHYYLLYSDTLSTWRRGAVNADPESEYDTRAFALADVVLAAEARLAQIRKLHAEKLAKDGLAADVPDEVKRRALDAIADAAPARTVRTIEGFEVEFELNDDLGTWHFHSAERRITGGGQAVLIDAIAAAREAVAFSLESIPEESGTEHASPLLPPGAIAQAREHEAFWAAVDAEMEAPGPEEVDSEHAAFVWAGFLTGLMGEDPETFDVRAVDDEQLPAHDVEAREYAASEHERLGRADRERESGASEEDL